MKIIFALEIILLSFILSCENTPAPEPPATISLNTKNETIYEGHSTMLSVFTSRALIYGLFVVWTPDNSCIQLIPMERPYSSCLVLGLTPGKSKIYVTYNVIPEARDSCLVEVVPSTAVNIEILRDKDTINVGEKLTLYSKVKDYSGSELIRKDLTWKISDTKIIEKFANSDYSTLYLNGWSKGSATVTATVENTSSSVVIYVK